MENVVSKVFVQAKPTCQGLAIVPHSTPAGDQPGSGDPTRVTGAVPLGVRRWTRQAGGPPLGEGESGQPAPALRGRLRGEREAETEDPVHAGDWSSPGAFSAPTHYLPPLPPASPGVFILGPQSLVQSTWQARSKFSPEALHGPRGRCHRALCAESS